MRQSIIIILLSLCQHIFCADTKCQMSLVSPSPQSFQKQRTQAQKIDELFYTVDSLSLDDNIVTILWTEYIYYLLDLVQYTESQLLKIPGVNKKDVTKIREKLLAKSFHLGMHLPNEAIQRGTQKTAQKKLSLYVQFIENTYSIPTDIPRNEFIERLTIEVEKLNNSRLYHPVQIEGHYNVQGAFKNIFLYKPTKLPDNNSDIRKTILRQISFIMMQNQIIYKVHHEI